MPRAFPSAIVSCALLCALGATSARAQVVLPGPIELRQPRCGARFANVFRLLQIELLELDPRWTLTRAPSPRALIVRAASCRADKLRLLARAPGCAPLERPVDLGDVPAPAQARTLAIALANLWRLQLRPTRTATTAKRPKGAPALVRPKTRPARSPSKPTSARAKKTRAQRAQPQSPVTETPSLKSARGARRLAVPKSAQRDSSQPKVLPPLPDDADQRPARDVPRARPPPERTAEPGAKTSVSKESPSAPGAQPALPRGVDTRSSAPTVGVQSPGASAPDVRPKDPPKAPTAPTRSVGPPSDLRSSTAVPSVSSVGEIVGLGAVSGGLDQSRVFGGAQLETLFSLSRLPLFAGLGLSIQTAQRNLPLGEVDLYLLGLPLALEGRLRWGPLEVTGRLELMPALSIVRAHAVDSSVNARDKVSVGLETSALLGARWWLSERWFLQLATGLTYIIRGIELDVQAQPILTRKGLAIPARLGVGMSF